MDHANKYRKIEYKGSSAVPLKTCTVTWMNGLQNTGVEQCIIQICLLREF